MKGARESLQQLQAAVFILAVATATVSCSGGGHDSAHGDGDEHSSHAASADAGSILDGIQLNEGAKWEMDDHTRAAFAGMASSFLETDPLARDERALKEAGAALQADIKKLIRGCTMTGAAHDQLHVFLTGYIPAVESLAEKGRAEDAKKVRQYLERYGEFFE